MANPPNELTGPRVYVAVDDKKSAKMHLTGGFHKPERDKAMSVSYTHLTLPTTPYV